MKKRDYEYYYNEWRTNVLLTKDVDYSSKESVRKYNRAVVKCIKISNLIGEQYPDKIDKFAENMNDENEGIRLSTAISLIQHMPHTKAQLDKGKAIVIEHKEKYMNKTTVLETEMMWNWWLSQPWCDESNCIDYKINL